MSNLIVKDRGWNRIMRDLGVVNGLEVKVGVQAGEVTKQSSKGSGSKAGISIPEIAAVHEYGSEKRNIPKRSVFAPTMEEKKDEITRDLSRLIGRVEDGKLSPMSALNIIGVVHTDQIKKAITDLRTPKNAEATIKRKKSDNPLIDTGQYRGSIKHKIERY